MTEKWNSKIAQIECVNRRPSLVRGRSETHYRSGESPGPASGISLN